MAEEQTANWNIRYWEWLRYVTEVVKTVEAGKSIPLGPSPAALVPPPVHALSGQPMKLVFCAPHPDDESLVSALPLRMRLEAGVRVTNVAITLGSNPGQRARRLRELESACRVLGFDLVVPAISSDPSGFDNVNLKTRERHPQEWAKKVEKLGEIFDREAPDVVFAPHAEDFNTTHIGTYFLVVEALGAHLERSGRRPLPLIQTEFWHELSEPNLMVGVSAEIAAIMLMAAAEHAGEMRRNPYHLLHPGRMMNNVRRGSEVVGGQGAAAQDFTFAELYRVTYMKGREVIAPRPGGCIVGPTDRIDWAELTAQYWQEGA